MRFWPAMFALLLAGCMAPSPLPFQGGTGHVLEGQSAPSYNATDLSGATRSLAEFEGQPILLHIWASWCSVCENEEAELERLYEAYGDRVAFVMVSIDEPRTETAMRDEASEWAFGSWWDPEDRIRPLFQVNYQPVSIFIDSEGTIDTVWQGQRADRTTLRAHPEGSREILDRLVA